MIISDGELRVHVGRRLYHLGAPTGSIAAQLNPMATTGQVITEAGWSSPTSSPRLFPVACTIQLVLENYPFG